MANARPTDQALQKVTQNDDVTMMKLLMKPVFMIDFPNFSIWFPLTVNPPFFLSWSNLPAQAHGSLRARSQWNRSWTRHKRIKSSLPECGALPHCQWEENSEQIRGTKVESTEHGHQTIDISVIAEWMSLPVIIRISPYLWLRHGATLCNQLDPRWWSNGEDGSVRIQAVLRTGIMMKSIWKYPQNHPFDWDFLL